MERISIPSRTREADEIARVDVGEWPHLMIECEFKQLFEGEDSDFSSEQKAAWVSGFKAASEQLKAHREAYPEAYSSVLAERERCARIADSKAVGSMHMMAEEIAKKIRQP